MYFLGSANRTRGHLEKRKVASLCNRRFCFFLNRPWSWWVPGSRSTKGACHTFEKTGADKQTGYFRAGWLPCKKLYYFCDGLVFFIDRDLLMGAIIWNLNKFQIRFEYHMFLKISKVLINSSYRQSPFHPNYSPSSSNGNHGMAGYCISTNSKIMGGGLSVQ